MVDVLSEGQLDFPQPYAATLISARAGAAAVVVTHRADVAAEASDVLRLEGGRLPPAR